MDKICLRCKHFTFARIGRDKDGGKRVYGICEKHDFDEIIDGFEEACDSFEKKQ